MDSTDPCEPMDSNEFSDQSDHRDEAGCFLRVMRSSSARPSVIGRIPHRTESGISGRLPGRARRRRRSRPGRRRPGGAARPRRSGAGGGDAGVPQDDGAVPRRPPPGGPPANPGGRRRPSARLGHRRGRRGRPPVARRGVPRGALRRPGRDGAPLPGATCACSRSSRRWSPAGASVGPGRRDGAPAASCTDRRPTATMDAVLRDWARAPTAELRRSAVIAQLGSRSARHRLLTDVVPPTPIPTAADPDRPSGGPCATTPRPLPTEVAAFVRDHPLSPLSRRRSTEHLRSLGYGLRR